MKPQKAWQASDPRVKHQRANRRDRHEERQPTKGLWSVAIGRAQGVQRQERHKEPRYRQKADSTPSPRKSWELRLDDHRFGRHLGIVPYGSASTRQPVALVDPSRDKIARSLGVR